VSLVSNNFIIIIIILYFTSGLPNMYYLYRNDKSPYKTYHIKRSKTKTKILKYCKDYILNNKQ